MSRNIRSHFCRNVLSRLSENNGAGEGNRTLVISLEGCCSTIELHPRRASDRARRAGSKRPAALARPRPAIQARLCQAMRPDARKRQGSGACIGKPAGLPSRDSPNAKRSPRPFPGKGSDSAQIIKLAKTGSSFTSAPALHPQQALALCHQPQGSERGLHHRR